MTHANIVGNVYDKYGTKNPIARHLMKGFLRAAEQLYELAAPSTVLEVGCGEGRLAQHLYEQARKKPTRFEACDLELGKLAAGLNPAIDFKQGSVYELTYSAGEFDLIVCCEVLEHLEEPRRALDRFAALAPKFVLLSTPREPLWRALNVMRGKYLRDLGNTPGHIQHFSKARLLTLVEERFDVVAVHSPIPWTMLLARPKS